ncbi:UNVERIFIED_CONTAM: hypothetical protein FKN15_014648 [Acipenser sinensis]
MDSFKELIIKINQNTAAQKEQNERWERELGLAPLKRQVRELTELELLLQRWEQARQAPLTPAPEPRGEEPPLPEPRGEEPQMPEPRGEEPPLPEPRGEEPPLPEPRGEELLLPEPRGEEPPLSEPRGEETVMPESPVEVKGEDVPPPLQASPALPREVPCPGSVDTGPECPDLPPLDLAPRSQYSQAQSPAWSLASLPLESQTSLRRRKTSLRKRQTSLVLPLLVAPFPLPTAPLPLESQTSLRRSTATHLCLPVLTPGHRPALWSPWTSRLGPSSSVLGPSLETPEGPTHPQARLWKRATIDIAGLEGGWSFKGGGRWPSSGRCLEKTRGDM